MGLRRPSLGQVLLGTLVVVAVACGSSGQGGSGEDAGAETRAPADIVPETALADIVPETVQCEDPGPEPLTWSPCMERFECTTLQVPVDYDDPCGPQIELSALRAPARKPEERVGMLLVNPGGPGVPVIEMAIAQYDNLALLGPALVDRFDLVGIDPRGVASSTPVDCVSDADLDAFREIDPTPKDTQGRERLDAFLREFADGCLQRTPTDVLASVHTENSARDMDRFREAAGEESLNYLGISYGTYLGAMYATLFPSRVRAFVLDSAVAPVEDNEEFLRTVAGGYESALGRFFADCGADGTCPFHGGEGVESVAAAFDELAESLREEPVLGTDGRPLSAMNFGTGLWAALRDGAWTGLAEGLATAEAGDPAGLMAFSDTQFHRRDDGTYANFLESLWAIQLVDFGCPPGYDISSHQALVSSVEQDAPRMASTIAMVMLGCVHWPVQRHSPAPDIDASTAPPMLVINSRYDPATPHTWAERLVEALGNDSYLLTWEGEGHATTSKSICAAMAAVDFLLDPSTPPESLTCTF